MVSLHDERSQHFTYFSKAIETHNRRLELYKSENTAALADMNARLTKFSDMLLETCSKEVERQLKVMSDLDSMKLHYQQQTQTQPQQSFNATQRHVKELVSAHCKALSSRIDEVAIKLQGKLDEECNAGKISLKRLREDADVALSQEICDRESEDHNLQVGLNELQEKVDIVKVEMNEMLQNIWWAVEMHTHDLPVSGVADTNSLSVRPKVSPSVCTVQQNQNSLGNSVQITPAKQAPQLAKLIVPPPNIESFRTTSFKTASIVCHPMGNQSNKLTRITKSMGSLDGSTQSITRSRSSSP